MAFLLKSSKLVFILDGITRQTNALLVKNTALRPQWKAAIRVNEVLRKNIYAAAVKSVAPELKELERIISQLQMDARHKHKIIKNNLEKVITNLENVESVSYPLSLLLLKCCSKLELSVKPKDSVELAFQLWSALEKTGVKFDISHYNALLNVFLVNEHSFSPSNFLENLEKNDISPNIVTYQNLLKAYCREGDITGATNLLEKMKMQDVPINLSIFNSLIHGHCQVNDFENASGILSLMKDKGIEPTSESYLQLACGYAKNGNIDKLNEVLSESEKNEIVFLDRDYLEIIYTLTTNGYQQHVDEFLEKLRKSFGYRYAALAVVQRLLHKNCDEVAVKIFKSIDIDDVTNASKYIINHIVKNKSTPDIIKFCEEIGKEGASSFPVTYALRQTLVKGDRDKSLELLSYMAQNGIPIRSHYFWPLIISASKNGNVEILNILLYMKKLGVPRCFWTVSKVLYHRYKFGKNWEKDLERLINHGVRETFLCSEMFINFVAAGNIRDASILAASRPVIANPKKYISELVDYVLKTKDVNSFVNIIYNVLHDVHIMKNKFDPQSETSSDGQNEENEIPLVANVNRFLERIFEILVPKCEEDVLLNILKEMLHNNIQISSEIVSLILSNHSSEMVNELTQKLASPDNQMIYNSELLIVKGRHSEKLDKNLLQALVSTNLENVETAMKELKDKASAKDIVAAAAFCLRIKNLEKAMEFFEKLKTKTKDDCVMWRVNKSESEYTKFMKGLASFGNVEATKTAYDIGVELDVVNRSSFYPVVLTYLNRGELEEATNYFCEKVEEMNGMSGFSSLAKALILSKNCELLEKFTNCVARVEGESKTLTKLMFEFAKLGQIKQTKKLLETKDFYLDRNEFYNYCNRFLREHSTVGFETLIEATKGVHQINRQIFFKNLLELYIAGGNNEKAKTLCAQAEEENVIWSSYFLKQVKYYLNCKSSPPRKDCKDGQEEEEEDEDKVEADTEKTEEMKGIFNKKEWVRK